MDIIPGIKTPKNTPFGVIFHLISSIVENLLAIKIPMVELYKPIVLPAITPCISLPILATLILVIG